MNQQHAGSQTRHSSLLINDKKHQPNDICRGPGGHSSNRGIGDRKIRSAFFGGWFDQITAT